MCAIGMGVEVLSYWSQEYCVKMASGAHDIIHIFKNTETSFPLEGIFSSPKCTFSYCEESIL